MSFLIESFTPKETSEELWKLYFDYSDKYMIDEYPDDPIQEHELEKDFIINPNKFYDIYRWIVFSNKDKTKVIGSANLWCENKLSPGYDQVKDIATFHIDVDRDFQRQGIGSEVLKEIVNQAVLLDKRIIRTNSTITRGKEFCKKINGKIVAERAQNRLYLSDVDWDLMNDWCKEGEKRAKGVTLEFFEAVPEKDIDEYCMLYTEVFNQAPPEDIPGKFIVTPERRREDEKSVLEKNYRWVTLVSREETGELSGLTEIYYHHSSPKVIEQELTGVLEAKQKRGIGKWLKARMLNYIKDEFLDAEYLITGNNDRNAPMLSINTRMGFKRHKSELIFEFDVKELKKKLGL